MPMRINRYIALATGMSRRAADRAIGEDRVTVNDINASAGQSVQLSDIVRLDGGVITSTVPVTTIILNKPVGYVCSRDGQGSKTIYDLLPPELRILKPVGRLDKDSSGLLLLTNDGELAHQLTHPSFKKEKVYEVEINKPLRPEDKLKIERGIKIDDYMSCLRLAKIENCSWRIVMSMGRNRQIRRTFAALGYNIVRLHRTKFGDYTLGDIKTGDFRQVN